MSEVLPNLWLGGEADSVALGAQADLVVNCTSNQPFHGDSTHQRQLRLEVEDNGDDRQQNVMLAHLADPTTDVLGAIQRALSNGQRVLVHCHMGRQRSAAVVAAYLMATTGCTVQQAVQHIQGRRRDAFLHSINFQPALDDFAAWLTTRRDRFR